MRGSYTIFIFFLGACSAPQNYAEESVPAESAMTPVAATTMVHPVEDDTLFVTSKSVVFFTPNEEDLQSLKLDQGAKEGIRLAVGDFAYYASVIADSLQSQSIPVVFTDKKFIALPQASDGLVIDRQQSNSLMGVALYDGTGTPQVIYGLQTHLTLWAAISKYFSVAESPSLPLLDYFQDIAPKQLHIYTSHSEILNQTGKRIDPSWHLKFGTYLAQRARKYHMGLFGYYKFPLQDSLVATICRVPSRFDESAIHLFVWDEKTQQVIHQLQLAENIWNDQWIMVMDSWINQDPTTGKFEIIQRKKEAKVENGQRHETDSLYRWKLSGRKLLRSSAAGLTTRNYPLKDWASYEEAPAPAAITEIAIVDEEFVWLPLPTGDLTYENLILEIPKGYSLAKEPIANQFNKHQMDTLFTLSKADLEFKFYRTPHDNLIIGGSLSTGAVRFKNGVQIGMGKAAFAQVFEKLKHRTELPDLINIKSKNGDRIFSCKFQNDTLAHIKLTNYIH